MLTNVYVRTALILLTVPAFILGGTKTVIEFYRTFWSDKKSQ